MKILRLLLLAALFGVSPAAADSHTDALRALAVDGDMDAQFELGVIYDTGEGVLENDAEAVKWYRLAAVQGHAGAQHSLGLMYAKGEGVPENHRQAVKWYRLAAVQGHVGAQALMGHAYAGGYGVLDDNIEAYAWLSIAAAQGHERARDDKQRITVWLIGRREYEYARQLAREYWDSYVVPFAEE